MNKKDREPRKAVELEVHLRDFSLTMASDESSWNLSRGGAFIKMDTPYPKGTLVKFGIKAPGDKTISGAGMVAWQRAGSTREDEPSGVGLQDVDLGLHDVELRNLADLVAAPDHLAYLGDLPPPSLEHEDAVVGRPHLELLQLRLRLVDLQVGLAPLDAQQVQLDL